MGLESRIVARRLSAVVGLGSTSVKVLATISALVGF